MKQISSIIYLFFSLSLHGQSGLVDNLDTIIYSIDDVDKKCELITEDFNSFLAKNIKYPRLAREKGVKGNVVAEFIVEKDGKISGIKILEGIGYGCDEEVLRICTLMPSWMPAVKNGKTVRCRYNFPVNFSFPR